MIFQYIHQTQSSLTYQMSTLVSKEQAFDITSRYPLDPPKGEPSDPDCQGHPTHIQP